MTPSFIDIDRRLVMRYPDPDMRTFNFSKVRAGASDEALYELANAFASIQSARPSNITTVLTRQVIF